jgi:hypothetical protein
MDLPTARLYIWDRGASGVQNERLPTSSAGGRAGIPPGRCDIWNAGTGNAIMTAIITCAGARGRILRGGRR